MKRFLLLLCAATLLLASCGTGSHTVVSGRPDDAGVVFTDDRSYAIDVNIDGIGRFGLVYNCMRWYAGTSVILHSNNYHKPRFSTNNTFGSWNIYVGYNFLLKKKL